MYVLSRILNAELTRDEAILNSVRCEFQEMREMYLSA